MSGNGVYQNEPRPRLCHLHRRPDFEGYGFNLHCDRHKPGQFIGKVDPNSPAESAGLQENDRIIEVNFASVENEIHKQVVGRIKEGVSRNGVNYPDEVVLLVVDKTTDDFYRSKGRTPKSSDPNVDRFETDMRDYSDNGSSSPQSSNRSIGGGSVSQKEINRQHSGSNQNNHHSPPILRTSDQDSEAGDEDEDEEEEEYNPSPPRHQPQPRPTYENANSSNQSPPRARQPERIQTSNQPTNALDFNMSVAEFRQKLTRNSRREDPRLKQQMTMKQKYDVVNNL